MIRVRFTSALYGEIAVERRYVRFDGDEFRWCECNAPDAKSGHRWDIRQGTCDESDLPSEVAVAARRLQYTYPSYVEWPM